jgi:tetratricopeptide (TPR) repeat protein
MTNAKKIKIVIHEPDEDFTKLVRTSLCGEFELSETISSSRFAVEKACEEGVDLVLLDFGSHASKTSSGLALAQWMASSPKSQIKRTPLLGIAGVLDPSTEKLLTEIGSSVFISRRPVSREGLLIDAKIAMGIVPKNAASRMTEDLAIRGFIRVVQESTDKGGTLADASAAVASKLEKHPNSPLLWSFLGGLRLDDRDPKGAELGAKKALGLQPSFLPAMNLMARVAVGNGDIPEALRWMEKASKISPLNILRHIAVGEIHLANGRLSLAEEKFKRSLKLDPDSLDAKMGLAKTYMEMGVPDGQKLVDEIPDPNLMASQTNLRGILLSMAGQQNDAMRFYSKAIKYLPTASAKEHLLRYNMALALLKSGDYTRAVSELKKGVAIKPTFEKGQKLLKLANLAQSGKIKLRYFNKLDSTLKNLGFNKDTVAFLRSDDSGMTLATEKERVQSLLKDENPKINHLIAEISNITDDVYSNDMKDVGQSQTSSRDPQLSHKNGAGISKNGHAIPPKSSIKLGNEKSVPTAAFNPLSFDED